MYNIQPHSDGTWSGKVVHPKLGRIDVRIFLGRGDFYALELTNNGQLVHADDGYDTVADAVEAMNNYLDTQ